jgi:hypothetical protein
LRGALATKPSSRGAPRPLDGFAALAMTVEASSYFTPQIAL